MNNSVLIGLLVIIIVFVGGFLVYYSQKNMQPPSSHLPSPPSSVGNQASSAPQDFNTTNQITLTVTQPVNNEVVKSSTITVTGKTMPGAEVAVNDVDIKTTPQGDFSTNITLDEGENTVVIIAHDAQGNAAEKDITVTYDTGNAYQ